LLSHQVARAGDRGWASPPRAHHIKASARSVAVVGAGAIPEYHDLRSSMELTLKPNRRRYLVLLIPRAGFVTDGAFLVERGNQIVDWACNILFRCRDDCLLPATGIRERVPQIKSRRLHGLLALQASFLSLV
jgi:hypothetical protein